MRGCWEQAEKENGPAEVGSDGACERGELFTMLRSIASEGSSAYGGDTSSATA